MRGIYLVAGLRFHSSEGKFLLAIEDAFRAGVHYFQLRTKNELGDKDLLQLARKVRTLTKQYKIPFFINERSDLALLCEADGVHVGSQDIPVDEVRKIVGSKLKIGVSNHTSTQLLEHSKTSADYFSIGPIFKTDCKQTEDAPLGLSFLCESVSMLKKPVVALGGITTLNLQSVLETQVQCVGVIREIMQSQDIFLATKNLKQSFEKYVKEQP